MFAILQTGQNSSVIQGHYYNGLFDVKFGRITKRPKCWEIKFPFRVYASEIYEIWKKEKLKILTAVNFESFKVEIILKCFLKDFDIIEEIVNTFIVVVY